MKTSLVSLVAFAGLFTGVFSRPTADAAEVDLVKRAGDPSPLIQSLYTTVQGHTATINSAAASLNSASTAEQNSTAASTIKSEIAAINSAVVSTTSQVKTLSAARALEIRQTANTTEIATLIEELLLDISGSLNNVIATLGLTATLGFLGPLVFSLSGLLLSLELVVNNLLAVVQELLDGLLTGLSVALAGLVL